MTAGHRHRIWHLPKTGARLHLLQTPLRRTADLALVERSRFAWGQDLEEVAGDGPVRHVAVYTLTPLGILHGLTGLTVCTGPPCLHQIGWSNYPPAGWTPGPGDWPPAPAPPWTRAMRWTWGR